MARDKLHYVNWKNIVTVGQPQDAFLKRNYIGKRLFIQAKSLREYRGDDSNVIRGAFREVVEESTYYGGVVRAKKDVQKEGFNFYEKDTSDSDFTFVRFDELEALLVLLDDLGKEGV